MGSACNAIQFGTVRKPADELVAVEVAIAIVFIAGEGGCCEVMLYASFLVKSTKKCTAFGYHCVVSIR